MDASTADSPRFFFFFLDLIKSIMRSLGNSADNFRASLVLYSFSATVLADLNSYTTPQRFEEVVNRATYLRGMGWFVCKCYNKLMVLNSTANCKVSRSAEKETLRYELDRVEYLMFFKCTHMIQLNLKIYPTFFKPIKIFPHLLLRPATISKNHVILHSSYHPLVIVLWLHCPVTFSFTTCVFYTALYLNIIMTR